jgi:hypothetical protein
MVLRFFGSALAVTLLASLFVIIKLVDDFIIIFYVLM